MLLASAVAYAANPVDTNCSPCGAGWDHECFDNHDSGTDHYLWSGQPAGYGAFSHGGDNKGGFTLFNCDSGATTGVSITAYAHKSNHGANGNDSDAFVCN